MPRELAQIWALLRSGQAKWYNGLLLLLVSVATVFLVIWITEGERRICPVLKRVVGRKMMGGYATNIPLRINQAGVIPVIFASSLLSFPATIASFAADKPWAAKLGEFFDYTQPWYTAMYAILIFGFTFFYTGMVFNPLEVADNMRKYGGFVPGMRPGKPTADLLSRIVTRITAVGALFLAIIAVLPNFMIQITGLPVPRAGRQALIIVTAWLLKP